ncbi:MAG: hypothetical protein D6806_17515, partial [Deltaproteobacteria bacterium]
MKRAGNLACKCSAAMLAAVLLSGCTSANDNPADGGSDEDAAVFEDSGAQEDGGGAGEASVLEDGEAWPKDST